MKDHHKKDAEQIKLAKEEWEQTFDAIPDIVAVIDNQHVIRRANKALAARLGVDRDELIGTFCHTAMCGLEKPLSNCPGSMALVTGKEHVEERFLDKLKGHYIISCTPISARDGSSSSFVEVCRDITERKLAEKSLKKGKTFIDNLIASMQDGLSVLDARGVHIQVNPALCQMTGFSSDELIGAGPPHPYWAPEAYEDIERAFQKTLGAELPQFELIFMRKNGERFPVIVSPSVIKDDQGNIISFFATVKDITERKKSEEQIRQSLKEKETLLREIHHRVKNNMAVVSGLLSLQASTIEDNNLRHFFEECQQRIESMVLVHEKLSQTKDLSAINFRDYINTLVQEIMSLHFIHSSSITAESNIEDIELDLESAIPCGLIINELLTNAFKYAFPDNRNGVLNISFKKIDDTYILTIKDNGVGLPKNFDYKKASTMGLQLVNILAAQLSGTFQIKSDKGTEAVVMFNAKKNTVPNGTREY